MGASAQAGLAAAAVSKAPAQGGSRPNILWFTSDQQRFDTIAALGNRRIRTPNQDRLVAEGVAFINNYCQNPVCTPSRASFLTGIYPSALHVNRNGNAYFPPEHTSKLLPRILAGAGYDCGMVGKFHLSSSYQRVEPRLDDGYRLFEWSHAPRRDWPLAQHSYHRFVRGRGVDWAGVYRTQPYKEGWPKEFSPGMPTEVHEATWCAEHAISFIKGALAAPWFISVNTYAPHPPHDPPREFLDRMDPASMEFPHFRPEDLAHQMSLSGIDHQTPRPIDMRRYRWREQRAAYYAQIELVDYQLGRVLEALEQTGQRENTLVIYTADHGEMLGDHGLTHKGCRFYEGAVHVPLLICWPKRFRAGVRATGLTELTDIVPTLLDAVGIGKPDYIQGSSLIGILDGRSDPSRHKPFARCEYHDALDLPGHSHANMIRDDRYKLVVYHGRGLGELYDLQEDPHEFRNLWASADHAPVKSRMVEALLDATMLATDPGQPRVGPM